MLDWYLELFVIVGVIFVVIWVVSREKPKEKKDSNDKYGELNQSTSYFDNNQWNKGALRQRGYHSAIDNTVALPRPHPDQINNTYPTPLNNYGAFNRVELNNNINNNNKHLPPVIEKPPVLENKVQFKPVVNAEPVNFYAPPPKAASLEEPKPLPVGKAVFNSKPEAGGGLRGSGPLRKITISDNNPVNQQVEQAKVEAPRVGDEKPAPGAVVQISPKLEVTGTAVNNSDIKDNDSSKSISELFQASAVPQIMLKELNLEFVLGGGGFGQVWKGTWRGTPVAVKILSSVCQRANMPDLEVRAFVDEAQMLSRLRHPNICLFMGVCWEPSSRAIVTELVSRGSLWDALRNKDFFGAFDDYLHHPQSVARSHWPLWAIKKVLDGTCKGLYYLHANVPPIIHRDLKSANILLDDSYNVKICDFGLARLKDFTAQMTANVGTVQWMSPEVIMGKPYNETADIYSLGIVAWELFTGKCPFEGMSQMEIAIQVTQKNARPPIPVCCTAKHIRFIQRCCAVVPSDRFTAEQALNAITIDNVFG